MINEEAVRNWDFGRIVQQYTQRDTMLYALGIGMGADPMDEFFDISTWLTAIIGAFALRLVYRLVVSRRGGPVRSGI